MTPRLRRHGDQDKPKGKRQCKTKHTSQRERERERLGLGLGNEELREERENKVSGTHTLLFTLLCTHSCGNILSLSFFVILSPSV